jgi:glycosyltransferase involved in cell wall biosynthesis
MKVLLWPTMYFPNIGGLEKMVHSLAIALSRRGHEVLVISNGEKTETFSIETIPVFTFPFIDALFKYQLPSIRQILKEISALFFTFAPDIVNIHGWFECFAFYQTRILEKHSTPVCLTIHGLLEQKHYHTENCQKLWHRAQAISTVSSAITPSEPHPFRQTIYNGLPIPQTPPTPLSQNRLLLIGRLTEEKCFHVAFHAYKLLLPRYPDLHLTLIGDGPEYEALVQLKQSLQLIVDMPGFVPPDKVQDFIDQSTVVLIPSSYESFSLVALEAALRGRPVVASRVLGLKEVVEDQITGLLVEPANPALLAAAIDTLLSDPFQMEQMGKNAFTRATSLFSIDSTVTQYVNVYEQASRLCHHSRL